MTDKYIEYLCPVLNTITSKDIRDCTKAILDDVPDYWFHVGASSTGKYHPAYSLGEGGLMRHSIAVVRFMNYFFELEQSNKLYTDREKDLLRMAALLHDCMKSGTQEEYENNKYTKFEHPLLACKMVLGYTKYLPLDDLKYVGKAIATHMGQWNTDKRSSIVLPKPESRESKLLHLCDYLASRKDLTVDFSGYANLEEVKPLEEYELPFMFKKHKGEKLIDVYKTDPDYIKWMGTLDDIDNVLKEYIGELLKHGEKKL